MAESRELLARVASLYYREHLTQADIAPLIGVSRSTVSRLLQEAKDRGVVEVIIHYPWDKDSFLATELKSQFGLHDAIVLTGGGRPYEEVLRGVGVLAAEYLDSNLTSDSILGISWGTAVFSTAQALRPKRILPITVVQMIGAVGTDNPLIDGPDLARFLANIYGGQYRYMHAPLVVEDQHVRTALLQEPPIRETLEYACKANIALVGIGSLVPEVSSLLRAGYLDRQELAELRRIGVSGDICAQHYDADGKVMDIDMNDRVVGITLDALGSIERVIGVACGQAKGEAILGALRGGHVNVLITDDAACRKLLDLNSKRETISATQTEEEVGASN